MTPHNALFRGVGFFAWLRPVFRSPDHRLIRPPDSVRSAAFIRGGRSPGQGTVSQVYSERGVFHITLTIHQRAPSKNN
jgi:hypothetical protein